MCLHHNCDLVSCAHYLQRLVRGFHAHRTAGRRQMLRLKRMPCVTMAVRIVHSCKKVALRASLSDVCAHRDSCKGLRVHKGSVFVGLHVNMLYKGSRCEGLNMNKGSLCLDCMCTRDSVLHVGLHGTGMNVCCKPEQHHVVCAPVLVVVIFEPNSCCAPFKHMRVNCISSIQWTPLNQGFQIGSHRMS